MAAKVNPFARGRRYGYVAAMLEAAARLASEALAAAALDILKDDERTALGDAVSTLTGVAQRLTARSERERKAAS